MRIVMDVYRTGGGRLEGMLSEDGPLAAPVTAFTGVIELVGALEARLDAAAAPRAEERSTDTRTLRRYA
ncbi:hypothetical protein ACWDRR_41380 [Kitasatospora sp. NPDC003701]